jgi:hypothetical protein
MDDAEAFVTPFADFLPGEEEVFTRARLMCSIYH